MAVTWDRVTNSTDLINYVSGAPSTNLYADSNTVSIMGQIWLPRIYGKDLTAFEIASSGKIAITINDVHSLDVSNSNYGAAVNSNILTTLNTRSNYALEMMTNNRQLKMMMDSYSNDITIHADSNIFVSTKSKDIDITAGQDFKVSASSNIHFGANDGNFQLNVNNSNMFLHMSQCNNVISMHTSSNINMYAASDMHIVASNNTLVQSECNVDIISQNASVVLSANQENMYVKLLNDSSNISVFSSCNMTTYVSNDWSVTASNNMTLSSESDLNITSQNASILLSANQENMYIKLLDDTSNIDIYSSSNMNTYVSKDWRTITSNNVLLHADQNVEIVSENASISFKANKDNMYIKLLDDTSNIDVYSSCNISVYAHNDWSLVSSNNTTIQTDSNLVLSSTNATISLSANVDNMYIKLLHDTSNVDIYSSCNMNTYVAKDWRTIASNDVLLTADYNVDIISQNASLVLSANQDNMYIKLLDDSSNIDVYSSSNISVYSVDSTNWITSNNYFMQADRNVDIISENANLRLKANQNNMYIELLDSSNISVYSSKDITTVCSNDMYMSADSKVDIISQNASVNISANLDNMYIKLLNDTSNIDIYSSCNLDMYTANDYRVIASNTAYIQSERDLDIISQNASVNISANLDNMYIKLLNDTSNIDIYSSSNITVYSGKDFQMTASNYVLLRAECNVDITSQNASVNISANLDNMYIKLQNDSSNISVYSSSNMNTYVVRDWRTVASNDMLLRAECNVDIISQNASLKLNANLGNMYINLVNDSSNIDVYSSCNITTVASNDAYMTVNRDSHFSGMHGSYFAYTQCNYRVASHDSNMYMFMNAPEDDLQLYSLSNISLSASNELFVTATSNIGFVSSNVGFQIYDTMTISACNSQVFSSCNSITIEARDTVSIRGNNVNIVTDSDISYSALSNLNFYITADSLQDPMFQINGDGIMVRGDLIITGSINTSNVVNTTVVQENLKITDKVIVLANTGDGTSNDTLPSDGLATNDSSGIEIDGFPNGVNSNEYDMHRKFLKWRFGSEGTRAMGTSNIETESYWDLQGGSLRITKMKNYGSVTSPVLRELAFGLRINENDELELFKKFWRSSSSDYAYKRVTKFGRILS